MIEFVKRTFQRIKSALGIRKLAKRDRAFRSFHEGLKERSKIPISELMRRRKGANELARQDKERSIQDRGITGMV